MMKQILTIILLLPILAEAQFGQAIFGSAKAKPMVYDTDAEAFFTRHSAAGGTLSNTEKLTINTFVVGLKNNGLYSKMREFWLFIGGTAATHALGFKNNNNLSFAGTNTHNSTGWTGSSNGYANTGIIPSAVLTNYNVHVSLYSRTQASYTRGDFGARSGLSSATTLIELRILISGASSTSAIYDGATGADYATGSNTSSLGLMVASRISSTNNAVYRGSTQIAVNTATSTKTNPTTALYIGALNDNGTAGSFAPRNICFASTGSGLTATEVSTLNTLVEQMEDSLGRGVQ